MGRTRKNKRLKLPVLKSHQQQKKSLLFRAQRHLDNVKETKRKTLAIRAKAVCFIQHLPQWEQWPWVLQQRSREEQENKNKKIQQRNSW